MNDFELYQNFISAGDENSFRTLFERYREPLTYFLYGLVGNLDDAEELMLDVFAAVSSGLARYREQEGAAFKTWLYSVARNKAKMFLRKHTVEFLPLDELLDLVPTDNVQDPFIDVLLDNERNSGLYQALGMIRPDYRVVLYLTYFEGMKPKEVSRVLHKSVKPVYNLISRGKTTLRSLLERT
ncbi:MAG: RNA polymerase sigma factor [Lachnospiraceae bacterium]|nr:RNA polymerase sigma factor [Lachnospiraceae bacterium]